MPDKKDPNPEAAPQPAAAPSATGASAGKTFGQSASQTTGQQSAGQTTGQQGAGQTIGQSSSQTMGQRLPTQESVELLIKLLQEFDRRTTGTPGGLPAEVQRDIAVVNAAMAVLRAGLTLRASPMVISRVEPPRGAAGGGDYVRIRGSHFIGGATVRFGNIAAREVNVVGLEEIEAKSPPGSGIVDVFVDSRIGSARLEKGFAYDGWVQ